VSQASSGKRPQWVVPPLAGSSEVWQFVTPTEDGVVRVRDSSKATPEGEDAPPDIVTALWARGVVSGIGLFGAMRGAGLITSSDVAVDLVITDALVFPRSERWREATSTALLGTWCDSLYQTERLPHTALGALKAEARMLHRQLASFSRRRTLHGRVLSLDAALGDGLSLYDMVAADDDLLAHTAGGVFEDERLNRVLRVLDSDERAVVFAYARGEGTTWTEAAAAVGAAHPEAFGERVRRKAKRLADEQKRRLAQRRKDLA
jgi:hypothetical protein